MVSDMISEIFQVVIYDSSRESQDPWVGETEHVSGLGQEDGSVE